MHVVSRPKSKSKANRKEVTDRSSAATTQTGKRAMLAADGGAPQTTLQRRLVLSNQRWKAKLRRLSLVMGSRQRVVPQGSRLATRNNRLHPSRPKWRRRRKKRLNPLTRKGVQKLAQSAGSP
ncbi:hypothetical protein Ciccas_006473 [Cichlidogyrus casuarinus]|uniref:Uncharacterized protein n=1 Tax=Cichlidogyrus casuarinus TaxID=1844966 RepID=A0ABD2Q5P0_9PLAT